MNTLKVRTWLAVLGLLTMVVWVLPNLIDVSKLSWYPSKSKLNYGLDIQGGLHLVMGADVDGVIKESTNRLVVNLKEEFAKKQIQVTDIRVVDGSRGEVTVEADASSMIAAKALLAEQYSTVLQIFGSSETSVTVRYFEAYMDQLS